MHYIGNLRRSGGTGRRAGLKIPWPQGREGSTPSSGTRLFPEPVHGGRTGFGRRAAGRGHSSTTPPTRAKSGDVPGGQGARKPGAAPPCIWPMPTDESCVAFASSLLRSKWRDRRGLRRATPSSGTIIFQAVTCPMGFAEGSFWSTVPLNGSSSDLRAGIPFDVSRLV